VDRQLHRLAFSRSKKYGLTDAREQRAKIEIDTVGPARSRIVWLAYRHPDFGIGAGLQESWHGKLSFLALSTIQHAQGRGIVGELAEPKTSIADRITRAGRE
jgi:hypothetical protein